MDIRTAPKKVDDSTGFSFLGVDDNELIKINPNDLIKTTSTYAQMRNNDASISPNANFAEVGRWSDGNPNNEDRLGYFVSVSKTEAGITMVKANADSCIRGVTTKKPAFAANASLDKYNTDGNLKPQYDYVCFSGFATVIDNGRCTANSQCMPSTDGTAVPSTNGMGYQVIERVDDTKVLILVEPSADMLNRIKNYISELETALESESENRELAVKAEKEAREAADNTLQTNINAEVTRAKNAESDLSTNISNEVTRAKNAESALSEDLIEEMANVESALNTTISNEVTRAKKAESDLSSSIQTSVSSHNSSTTAHDDIRTLINNLTARINAVANSEDVDLDQLSEIVAYIKSNRSLIDNVTTSKVSVSDIIDNLTSTSANKPLSANQGRVLNTSIASLTTKLNNHIDSLSNVENKSSETIRSEITKKNVIDALGYTPGTSSTEPITYTLSKSGSKITLTSSDGTETSVIDSDTNTTYSAGTGIALSGTTFSNAGVRSISSGSTNGTISVNTNGTSAEVAVKGLGSAAYTASNAYAAASHTHNYAGSSSAGGSATSAISVVDYGDTSRIIEIGYSGSGATTSNLLHIAGYLSGGTHTRIKDVSKDTLKSWLGLGSAAYTASGNYASSSHTHSYAGSSSAGGSATSAVKLDTSAGSATQPVYFSGGKPVACSYTLGKSVPSNAVFTDTWRGIQDNLTSTSTTDSLSAKQGKVLNEKFGTTLTSTLSAGSTSLVFSNSVITTSSTIDLYTDAYGVNPTDVRVEAGKMTLTFDAQTKDISVKAVIK